jgi:hypothetical protein
LFAVSRAPITESRLLSEFCDQLTTVHVSSEECRTDNRQCPNSSIVDKRLWASAQSRIERRKNANGEPVVHAALAASSKNRPASSTPYSAMRLMELEFLQGGP